MYYCDKCEHVFSEDEAGTYRDCVGFYGSAPAYEEWAQCPYCGSIDLEEAEQCEVCGEYFCEADIHCGICENCHSNIISALEEDITAGVDWFKDEPGEEVEINKFLLLAFGQEEIEEILTRELVKTAEVVYKATGKSLAREIVNDYADELADAARQYI